MEHIYGLNNEYQEIIIDRKKLSQPHALVAGQTGAGIVIPHTKLKMMKWFTVWN